MFRVSRCQDVEILDEPADRADGVDLEAIWEESRRSFRERFEFIEVVVDVDASTLPAVSHVAKVLSSEPAERGDTRLTLKFSDRRHALNVLWRFADGVVVVEPDDVRLEVADRVRAMVTRLELHP